MTDPAYRVVLPRPPSTNNLFATVGHKRVKVRRYKAWIEAAGKTMLAAGPRPHLDKPVRMLIEGVGRLDVDNIKAVPDLLVSMGVLADDRLIDDLRIVRVAGAEAMTVSIWPMEGIDASNSGSGA